MTAPATVPQILPEPAFQGGSPDDDGCDRLELPQKPRGARSGAEPRHVDQRREADAEALKRVAEDLDAVDRDGRVPGDALVWPTASVYRPKRV